MRSVIRLTESDLHNLIESSVKKMLKEYGDTAVGQNAMGKAAKRAAFRGDDSVYHNAMDSLGKNKYKDADDAKKAYGNFQKSFEEGEELEECGITEPMEEEEVTDTPANNLVGESKKPIKLTESQLYQIINEAVKDVLFKMK